MTQLKKITLENPNNLKVEYFTPDQDEVDILVIKVIGTCGQDTSISADARYIFAMGEAAVSYFEPYGIILDYSELDYQVGDDMEITFSIGASTFAEEEIPFAVVVGPACEDGIATLIENSTDEDDDDDDDEYDEEDDLSPDWVFNDINSAIAHIKNEY